MAILIKRYANRKLYNTETSRYITLKGIAELIENGDEVRVVDNETGEDITSIALSQILVDNERSKSGDVPGSVLTELISKGGDVLYTALRRGVGDAQGGIEEFQKNVRKLVQRDGEGPLSDWVALTTPDMEKVVQRSVERVLKVLDLPRRSDIDALNQNLDRVAQALENLGHARSPAGSEDASPTNEPS
ncbi:MAG: polyhydroxyalkanoate synthesis regulator DNA-binding domain-containing protein [Deltaproteobacteria bacterium]|nr:polyhydroxyalkanoate synthesis regulator DNA-binding domain-containing protein [Deltaproteobacteria bacterium]MBW2445708.1 polyhydroxyalkanoate synthesis regulator DNA-binding domain-containing protein [Deltaproteobacteria bacterium]